MESQRLDLNPIECVSTLYNNAFLFAPLFTAFYRTLGRKDRSALLAYLILPLVLPELPRNKLARTTSLRTFTAYAERERTYGLAARISERRKMTNLALQHNFDQGFLMLGETAEITADNDSNQPTHCPPDMLKAATKFAQICQPHSVPAIFLALGIKRL